MSENKDATENLGSSRCYADLLRFRQVVDFRLQECPLPEMTADGLAVFSLAFGKRLAFERVLLDLDKIIDNYEIRFDRHRDAASSIDDETAVGQRDI